MKTQRVLGRAQARQGRMSRKAKRGVCFDGARKRLASTEPTSKSLTVTKSGAVVHAVIVRNVDSGEKIVTHRQRFDQEGLGDLVRQGIGGDKLIERSTANLSGRQDRLSGDVGGVETEYVSAKTYLQVRLKTDTKGQFKAARERLLELACEFGFGYRSANGPTSYEDGGRVWIKLKAEPVDACPLARELRAGGWKQYHSDRRVFCKKSTKLRETWAVDFCERHSGEWWTLSKVSREAVDRLYRSVDWCELFERTRPLPGNGTNEHAKQFHRFRKPVSKPAKKRGYQPKVPGDSMRTNGGFLFGETVGATIRMRGNVESPPFPQSGSPASAFAVRMAQGQGYPRP